MTLDRDTPDTTSVPDTADASAGDDRPAEDLARPEAATPGRRQRTPVLVVALAIVSVLAGSAIFVSGWTLGRQAALTPGTPAGEAADFQPFWDTYRAITDRYAGGSVDRKTLVEGAIKGLVGALGDPYSQYLTSTDFQNSLQTISGQFEGIGATIGAIDASGTISSCSTLGPACRLQVVAPLPGSPAERAGLRSDDVIAAIDGGALDGLSVDAARSRVRGPAGSTVTLSIVRGGRAPFDVSIVRELIVTPEVETRDLAGGAVAYVRLAAFSDNAAQQLDEAVRSAVGRGQRAIVLDLRGNPGGYVTAAREVASQFLADGTIFWQEAADGSMTATSAISGGAATDPSIRVAVLVDGGSASASEIVAGALHDRGRATLIGSRTFGKGTVQQWTQLENDSGGFRLTVAKWLTPDRTWVNHTGIVPDVVVEPAAAPGADDPVIDKALEVLGAQAGQAP